MRCKGTDNSIGIFLGRADLELFIHRSGEWVRSSVGGGEEGEVRCGPRRRSRGGRETTRPPRPKA